jgi:hypothetical protein
LRRQFCFSFSFFSSENYGLFLGGREREREREREGVTFAERLELEGGEI